MNFRSLRVRDFRNFRNAHFNFSPRLNILVGDNGQGKTNLLEALYLSAKGEGFRIGDNSDFIHWGQNQALLETELQRKKLDYSLRVLIMKTRKSVNLNEKKVTSTDLRSLFPCVLFSPESLAAIKEGADSRRELIDDFLVTHQPTNSNLLLEYRKALRSRNRLLKDAMEGVRGENEVKELLDSLNPAFFRLAARLTSARTEALRDVLKDLNQAMQYVSKDLTVDISVEYLFSDVNALHFSPDEVLQKLQARAQELQAAELSFGSSLVGPHKHDIVFLYNQKDSRFFCSQGQQRALILSFKMAQIVYHRRVHGIYPVLMLDDVLSELDSSKRKALVTFLHEIQTQVFLTTTDIALPDHFSLEDSSVVEIRGGSVVGRADERGERV